MMPKIKYILYDVIIAMGHSFPDSYRDFIFGDDPDMEWAYVLAKYYLFEVFKYAIDKDAQTYSLRHFLNYNSDDNTERMVYSRVIKYVQKYKNRWYEELTRQNPDNYDLIEKAKVLLEIPMDTIKDRITGHRISEMTFFELTNIVDLRVIKATVERRIVSSKKVSNDEFVYAFSEYDQWVEKLKTQFESDDESCIFASLSMFNIEWKYSYELIYKIACLMEERNIAEIDAHTLLLLCGDVSIESRLGIEVRTHSRMVVERQSLLYDLIIRGNIDFLSDREILCERFAESIALITIMKEQLKTKEGDYYRDWIIKQVDKHDIAEFFREYNVFRVYKKKDLNKQRIHLMRNLYNLILK